VPSSLVKSPYQSVDEPDERRDRYLKKEKIL